MNRYYLLIGVFPAGYALVLLALYFLQGSLLFLPPDLAKEQVRFYGASRGWTRIPLMAQDGTELNAWHGPAYGAAKGVVIYAHGNGGWVFDAMEWKTRLQKEGWHVLSVGYRGYPDSDGSPSEWGLKQDISATYMFACSELKMEPDQIVFHGRSLGGGLVGAVMLDLPNAGLILESTFTSITDRASELYPYVPVRWLLKHRFETALRAPEYTQPVLILHSTHDEVIPVAHGRRLSERFPSATYVEMHGWGHNDAVLGVEQEYTQTAISFLTMRARRPEGGLQ